MAEEHESGSTILRLVNTVDALIEGQKRLYGIEERLRSRLDGIAADVGVVGRRLVRVETTIAAAAGRLDEADAHSDRLQRDIRDVRSEVVLSRNEILNAVQSNLGLTTQMESFDERLTEVERRLS